MAANRASSLLRRAGRPTPWRRPRRRIRLPRPGGPIPEPSPAEMRQVGNPRSWEAVGREFTGHLRELCGLRSDHAVLDIGCGLGRIARHLTETLSGPYEGFDVVRPGIEWCASNITPRYPNFNFTHADVYNGRYNPRGRYAAESYRFPYPDTSFDVAFATSVFTHMLPPSIENYLEELRRVLRGKALLTFLLWTGETREAGPQCEYDFGRFRVERIETPEDVVAIPKEEALEMIVRSGLQIEAVHLGRWARREGLSRQDLVIVS